MSLGACEARPAAPRAQEPVAAALVAALDRWNAGRDGDRLAVDLEAIIGLVRRNSPPHDAE